MLCLQIAILFELRDLSVPIPDFFEKSGILGSRTSISSGSLETLPVPWFAALEYCRS
jgi:hypothetical protein